MLNQHSTKRNTAIEAKETAAKEDSAVKTLRKAMLVLDVVASAPYPLTIAEIAAKASISRPTAYRLVQTLVGGGYLAQDALDNRISVGMSVLGLAGSLLDNNRFRIEALPHLQELAIKTGERTNLGVMHRSRLLYLAGVEKPTLPTIYSRFGKTVSANCCSLGKAILANLPREELDAYFHSVPLEKRTSHSLTSEAELRADLEAARERGCAFDAEEYELGSSCIAAPVLKNNYPIGAIGVTGRNLDQLMQFIPLLHHKAEVLSHVV